MRARRPLALAALALCCARAHAHGAVGAQSAGSAWSEIYRATKAAAGSSDGARARVGAGAGGLPLARRFDLRAFLRAARTEVAARLGGAWSQRGALVARARERARISWAWLRAAASPPALRARGAALRSKGAALANGSRRLLVALRRRLAVALPVVARQLHAALDGLAAELGVLPLLHGGGHVLRGLILLGGRLGDHIHAHYRPAAPGECTFRSAGAFARHFALDGAVLEARRATACQPLKRAARAVLVRFHPDKMAVTHAGCAAELSVEPMQAFLVEYAESKGRLCGR
ncbi:hypothetical protein KFE25_004337 [Diacronema lutheri]|uniref:J domain-containing protein n=1 Tax=Diacronema lutheri TaxID=2081491 RepID=A0A8J5X5S2_DIALT|nr:hypothetical protein KFE25_004337 [Diacronema lutheri]